MCSNMECVYLRRRFLWHFRWKRWFIRVYRRIPVDVHDDNEVVEVRAIAFIMDVLRTRTHFSSILCVTNRTSEKFRNWSAGWATETIHHQMGPINRASATTTTRRAAYYYNCPASKRRIWYSNVFLDSEGLKDRQKWRFKEGISIQQFSNSNTRSCVIRWLD